jgi:SAM-dependent methyltransferase
MALPRLYDDLAWIWPFLSPPEEYGDEVATFFEEFDRLGVPEGARLLHLGSGGGSIDWHLKRTYRVTGVDISPQMLAYARQVNPEVEYLPGDIRDVRLGRTFDAVLLHDAAAYLTPLAEVQLAYATAAAHLAPGGVLVTPPEELRSHFRQHAVDAWTRTIGERTVTTVEVDFDPDSRDQWFETTYLFLIREAGQPLRVEHVTEIGGIYHLEELLGALRVVGFEPEVTRYDLPEFPPDEEYPLITAVYRGPNL